MTVQKKTPERLCIGCQTVHPKKELVRVVRSPENEVSVDLTGKKSGRGAYICRSADCLKKALKGDRLQRALSCTVSEDVAKTLVEEIRSCPQ